MSSSGPDLTALFARMRRGDAEALNAVMRVLYAELHHLAVRHMRGEARQHTSRLTALINKVAAAREGSTDRTLAATVAARWGTRPLFRSVGG